MIVLSIFISLMLISISMTIFYHGKLNAMRNSDNISIRNSDPSGWLILSWIATVITTMIVVCMTISMGTSQTERLASVHRYQSFAQTIEDARTRGDDVERVGIIERIAAWNAWLAESKYWNKTQWDAWYPDEVESLEPIKP